MHNHFIGLEPLSPQQEQTLKDFKGTVSKDDLLQQVEQKHRDKYIQESHLVRLLVAREWNLKSSIEQWQRWVQMRLKYNADNIKQEEIQSELDRNKAYWHPLQDKQKNPCIVIKAKNHFPGQSDENTLIRFFIYMLDEGIKKADEAGTGRITVIWDRQGTSRKNFDTAMFGVVKQLLSIVQDNYAERLHKAYILYPNFIVKMVMNVCWPFLSTKTREKLIMLDDMKQLQNHLGQEFEIPFDGVQQLPQEDEKEFKQQIQDFHQFNEISMN